ncbi:hypothetical protein HBH51_245390 [Parastagonospora nodorum]|nr:hypothetical protein HBH51_245390 [Parastagonospora nodorum]
MKCEADIRSRRSDALLTDDQKRSEDCGVVAQVQCDVLEEVPKNHEDTLAPLHERDDRSGTRVYIAARYVRSGTDFARRISSASSKIFIRVILTPRRICRICDIVMRNRVSIGAKLASLHTFIFYLRPETEKFEFVGRRFRSVEEHGFR